MSVCVCVYVYVYVRVFRFVCVILFRTLCVYVCDGQPPPVRPLPAPRRTRPVAGFDVSKDKMALQRIREAAEKAKIELSSATQTDINLPFLSGSAAGPVHFLHTLNRSKFETLVAALIRRTVGPCEKCLEDAGLRAADVDEVVLVGGMTRMPAVRPSPPPPPPCTYAWGDAAGRRIDGPSFRPPRLFARLPQSPPSPLFWTRGVHLDAPGQRHGQQPVSGTADPRSSQTGQVIRGLRRHDQNTFGPTEGRNAHGREAHGRHQRQTNQHHGLRPPPLPPGFVVIDH